MDLELGRQLLNRAPRAPEVGSRDPLGRQVNVGMLTKPPGVEHGAIKHNTRGGILLFEQLGCCACYRQCALTTRSRLTHSACLTTARRATIGFHLFRGNRSYLTWHVGHVRQQIENRISP